MAHIIICDDDAVTLKVHKAILEQVGHSVTPVPDGADVLRLLAEGTRCDVVVTDGNMAKINGWDLLKEVQGTHPSIPVILVSALVNLPEQLEKLGKMGFSAILAKPLQNTNVLRDAVTRALTPLKEV